MSNAPFIAGAIESVTAKAYTVPTDAPESDGTFAWNSTTLVVTKVAGRGKEGLGYTYCARAAADLISDILGAEVLGLDPFETEAAWARMARALRNIGRPGIGACAMSALDIALWDLKAKLLDASLVSLLGHARPSIPIYGSGGFTSYSDARLKEQLSAWVNDGCDAVKMKVGAEPESERVRMASARDAIGRARLFIDANGACTRQQALLLAERAADYGVTWFEEPVSSDDLEGLCSVRNGAPAGMDIAAGEYGYTPYYFHAMLAANAVDVLQADATRCGGITGFLRASALCDAFQTPLSCHCAPSAHLALACAAPRVIHMEWFHDHVRIEQMLFDGAPRMADGRVASDATVPGHGLTFRDADAARFEI